MYYDFKCYFVAIATNKFDTTTAVIVYPPEFALHPAPLSVCADRGIPPILTYTAFTDSILYFIDFDSKNILWFSFIGK